MNANGKYVKAILMTLSAMLLTAMFMTMVAGGGVPSAQAGPSAKRTPKVTRTPTRAPTATRTVTPIATSTPFGTSTPTPIPGPSGAWNLVASPNTGWPVNRLYSVSGLASNDVWAVGSYRIGNSDAQLIEHWNGTGWSIVKTPSLAGTNELRAVTAVASNDVWAFGNSGSQTFIEHWNGSAWSIVPNPNPGTLNVFYGAAAVSANNVWAVGYFSVNGGYSQTLVEHWNGSNWSVIPSPNVPNDYNQLNAVTAVPGSPNELWAVGYSSGYDTLTMHWDGTQWSIVPSPNPGTKAELYGVTAVSSNDVWAAGYTDGHITLTLHWNGAQWNIVSSPNPSEIDNKLFAVAARATNDVWAVGYYNGFVNGQGGLRTLLLHWNGTSWAQVPGDNSGLNSLSFELIGVDVIGANDVWSVGDNWSTLAEHWNGSAWSKVASPNAGVGENTLYGVSGSSANDAWAVGFYTAGRENRTLIEHWNGTSWSVVPSPNASGLTRSVLKSVVALSASNAWAVGFADNSGEVPHVTLILHWDGTRWSIVPSPSPGTMYSDLYGMAASSATDIWAVGSILNSGSYGQTLVEHWNGSAWSVIPSPNVAGTNSVLYAGVALGANNVWAVGYSGASVWTALVEHWNGTNWSIIPSPDRRPQYSDILYGAAASGASDVWGVGEFQDTFSGGEATLSEHWNGNTWSVVRPVAGYYFRAAAALSPGDAWAVGSDGTYPLTERWNGSNWSIFPNPRPVGGTLYAVDAIAACDLWAVGDTYTVNARYKTLIMHFTCQ